MKKNKILAIAAVFFTAVYLIFMYNTLQYDKLSKNYEVWYTEQGDILGYNVQIMHEGELITYFIEDENK
jgi:NADH:ubiquinone oxidoreductase subunit 4 (subunit M)